jgi:hypothetical protein
MKWQTPVLFGLILGLGFAAGRGFSQAAAWSPVLEAQGGRGPVNAPPAPPTTPVTPPPAGTPSADPVVYVEDSGSSSASGNGFLAVTGSYGVGTSVLYLIDAKNRQLAVYEARGGGPDMRRIVFVGARKIDLDLQIEGYNDRSEFEYRRLRGLFEKRDAKDPTAPATLPGSNNSSK